MQLIFNEIQVLLNGVSEGYYSYISTDKSLKISLLHLIIYLSDL